MAVILPFTPRHRQEVQEAPLVVGNTVLRFPGSPSPVPAPAKPKTRTRGKSSQAEQRNAMLAKVHIAKKSLLRLPGFDETVYRAILAERFGVSSAADLSNSELHLLLLYFASLGWQGKKGRHRKSAPETLTHDPEGIGREERMAKIEAMLAEKGRAEQTDMPWAYAVAILKRQTAHDHEGQVKTFEKASPKQLDAVIAALYRDAKRKGRKVR